jgi:hypothetical protein
MARDGENPPAQQTRLTDLNAIYDSLVIISTQPAGAVKRHPAALSFFCKIAETQSNPP